jgi:uncharacterized protein with PIN domain
MQETKNLVEEALIQMKNVEDVIAENAKGILASTMKEEISQLVKESLTEQMDVEDEVEVDTELDLPMGLPGGDEEEVDFDIEDSEDEDEPEMDMEFSDDTIDLRDASDEEILKIFKAMGEEDGIIVSKDDEEIHIKDNEEDVEYIVKMNEAEEMDEELEEGDMEFEELDEADPDLEAVLSALYDSNSETMEEEMDEVVYEIEMSEEDDDEMEEEMDESMEMDEEMEEEMDESMEMDEEMEEEMDESEMEEGSEDYHLEEAKMTVKPKGVGIGSPKFKYDKSLPKKGFDEDKKEGPKTMGTGKAKFEFKEGQGYDDKEDEREAMKHGKLAKKDLKSAKARRDDAHFETRKKKEETKEAARTYGMGSKEGRGLRKGITNNRNYVYGNNGVKVESIDAELKLLREKNEEYRQALNVFREKLNEVAVFNSNLAYATRLFTEHSTTKKEKINILRRFDSVENLKESKSLYKTIKEELNKVETQSVNENVERKLNNQMSSGSSTTLIESKTYENPQFMRIKDLMSKI